MKTKTSRAFSLIELSIVILIIGILVAGVTQGSRMVRQMALTSARSLSKSSDVASIRDLVLWLDATAENSLANDVLSLDVSDGETIKPRSVIRKKFPHKTTSREGSKIEL